MIDTPAYVTVNGIFHAVIVESVDVRIFVEESQNINEALFCVVENSAYFVAEANVISFCLWVINVFGFGCNVEIAEP